MNDSNQENNCENDYARLATSNTNEIYYYLNNGSFGLHNGDITKNVINCLHTPNDTDKVDKIYGIWDTPKGKTLLYQTKSINGQADLFSIDLSDINNRTRIALTKSPEYRVQSVTYSQLSDSWVISAIEDLTEIITLVERSNPDKQIKLDPFPYNDFSTLLLTIPDAKGGFMAIVQPYIPKESGIDFRLYTYKMDNNGNEIWRYILEDIDSHDHSIDKIIPLISGDISFIKGNCSYYLASSKKPTLAPLC